MPWNKVSAHHECHHPGPFRIWLRNARAGSTWVCPHCAHTWVLRRQTYYPLRPTWRWDREWDH